MSLKDYYHIVETKENRIEDKKQMQDMFLQLQEVVEREIEEIKVKINDKTRRVKPVVRVH